LDQTFHLYNNAMHTSPLEETPPPKMKGLSLWAAPNWIVELIGRNRNLESGKTEKDGDSEVGGLGVFQSYGSRTELRVLAAEVLSLQQPLIQNNKFFSTLPTHTS
jgi:hypothetical protein